MTYLDDEDHEWELEKFPPRGLLSDFKHLCENMPDEKGLEVILLGYEGLRKRHPEASVQDCFSTSMVWYFG